MLVSPIIGPCIGLGYGTIIWNWALVRKSLRNECISLLFCIAMGMVIGACTGWTSLAEKWPTAEMANRGNFSNFLIALPVAFFSGLGVAVSILDEQTASLVGVAISASLLPPAVDAGVSIMKCILESVFGLILLSFSFCACFAGILWIAYAFTKHGVIPTPLPINSTRTPEEQHVYSREEFRQMVKLNLIIM
jgi:uncharacterized membrane protein